ncbi:MAG: hypothetical protein KKE02_15450 [Alphaproteobacteria bacterium]|nr:hypothetical protein [Alphaproteobacteria bacterium]MBU1516760.1 hypothetical protein [Alphaproteobacteria bacterium]MBU2092454.1 hypothetical protein [Alphaproteobacteria bacterium]MBU2152415.1 hypothetical protein [Alphaproteobacteria bacterium]MBU2305626.1 hypothetical protein [Alphaproteobacteria bacterium]
MRRAALLLSAALLAAGPAMAQPDPLLAGFQTPPQAAKPRVWWHWLSGNVSLEGAKLDLAWMQRVGIGGVHSFSGGGLPEPKLVDPLLPYMSPGWRDVFRETTRIAHDAGMEVGIAGSPGWSQTGGVWVPPADGMKKYVWSVTEIDGGKAYAGSLAALPTATGPFLAKKAASRARQLKGDVAADAFVIAFPTPAAEGGPEATFVSSAGAIDLAPIAAEDLAATVQLPIAEAASSAWIQAAFAKPTRVSALTLGVPTGATVEVQASDDGASFRPLTRATLVGAGHIDHPAAQQTLAFAPTTAKVFRVVLSILPPPPPLPGNPVGRGAPAAPPKSFSIAKLAFETGARVQSFEAKAGFQPSLGVDPTTTPTAPADAVIDRAKVVDLSARLGQDGRLDWTPPPGRWTVLRFGWSLTGQTNGPAEAEATGLEVDKLDPAAVRRYIDAYLGLYAEATGGKLGPDGVSTLLTDSWEAGVQNWTPGLLAEFRRRRGYDPLPFTPALAGRVVTSAEASDRFLWDYRLTLKEMLADNHYGVLAKALHERGMAYYTEAQGDTPRALGDGMTMKARSDIPTAEYWYRPFAAGPGQLSLKADLEEAASAAHVYGKPLVAAEALTVAAGTDPWSFSPRMLKPVADEIFARGVNRFLIHDSRLQPLVDAKPGVSLFWFGQFFNRNETWAEEAGAWVSYLARTSYMLQQGRYVADVAYFYGEDRSLTEQMRRRLNTDVPPGYRYDYINPEALLTLLSVRDGRVVTPSGMSYRVLFLPDHVTRLTGPAAAKVRELVAAGAVVVGPKPTGALGLGSSDEEIRKIADEVWGPGDPPQGHAFGKGRVYRTLAAALEAEKVAPDVAFQAVMADPDLLALHRRTDDADVYFVSNQKDRAEAVQATFRVQGKAPEIWRAETGAVEAASYRRSGDGATTVPLSLAPHEAVFVVFRKPATAAEWQAPTPRTDVVATLEGPWSVSFEPGRAAPPEATFDQLRSWTDSADPGVKYFSGGATYRKTVKVQASWFGRAQRVVLDLGEVRELATVSVNGKPVATSWHAPYRVDVTDALRKRDNQIEIKVVNLWPNRLIGDKQPGAKPVTFAPISPYTATSPLLPSGLLGPVRLLKVTTPPAP